MLLFNTTNGPLVQHDGSFFRLAGQDWDTVFNERDLVRWLAQRIHGLAPIPATSISLDTGLLPPIGHQEVWGAGVTYHRSRDARMEEAKGAGGGDFYARVYEAERPELFFKATAHRVVGHRQAIRIRKDAKWNVPEPELTIAVNSAGEIIGYTVGNDACSRDIEGENPLYLPQAKIYDGCCALGPAILLGEDALPVAAAIKLQISRGDRCVFTGATALDKMRRTPQSLVKWLYRECSFPRGCLLLTGTGVVPPDAFTLQPGDEVAITIEGIGTLVNTVEQ
jgi:2-dehydro-3-deoxy-D-arabinonate dehydratase